VLKFRRHFSLGFQNVNLLKLKCIVKQSDESAKSSKLAGFLLWRAGYDVWLSNQRGTLFSEDHTNNSISYLDYWDFGYITINSLLTVLSI
jgi:hypothetical protein